MKEDPKEYGMNMRQAVDNSRNRFAEVLLRPHHRHMPDGGEIRNTSHASLILILGLIKTNLTRNAKNSYQSHVDLGVN